MGQMLRTGSKLGAGRRQLFRGGAVLVLALAIPATASAGRLSSAQKQVNEFFKGRSFVAKIDLETTGKYFVDPEGFPIEQKKQGRRKRLGVGQRDLVFAAGAGGHGIYVRADESDREVVVTLAKKRGPTMHAVKLYIQYPREITEVRTGTLSEGFQVDSDHACQGSVLLDPRVS